MVQLCLRLLHCEAEVVSLLCTGTLFQMVVICSRFILLNVQVSGVFKMRPLPPAWSLGSSYVPVNRSDFPADMKTSVSGQPVQVAYGLVEYSGRRVRLVCQDKPLGDQGCE